MAKSRIVTLYNASKQSIPVQVRPPGSDFYSGEQQVWIKPGGNVQLPWDYLNQDQIDNLLRRSILKKIYDSKTADEKDLQSQAVASVS